MRAQVVLPVDSIRLEPGGHATRHLQVRNLGLTPDRFTFEVVGSAASWTTLDPPVLLLGPDGIGQVTVHFHPPRVPHVRAGTIPFGVLTTSAREAAGSVVEKVLEMGRFSETVLDLVPCSIRRLVATFRLTVANRGNATLRVSLRGRDPAAALRVECTPARLTVFPGTVVPCEVRIRPRDWRWRGSPLTRPFQVIVDSGEGTPLIAAGEWVHRPILPCSSS